MQTKVTGITQDSPQTLQVAVDFIDGENVVLSKTYLLQVDQDISTLYPQFKEDLNSLEAGKQAIANLGDVAKEIDLSDVKSTSEIQAEVEAQAAVVATKEAGVKLEPTSPTEPLA